MITRCAWAANDPLLMQYHDEEWGRPVFDDNKLFEMLLLEGAQAGLSWLTVLKKRENYRTAFDGFDAHKIASYDSAKIAQLLLNEGIIRNRLKINSAVTNAQAFLSLQEQYGDFQRYIWSFVNGEPIINHWPTKEDVPVTTKESDRMSKELKKRGFRFVGSTICYSFMQATGMVNDHTIGCANR
ncbi:DNA-3-methyladenine glycosylase I [Aneurinibacillus sp. Ricciae_BoGa-3]|uniref:DNA-3-methyladenine glycosylase I n=1 Tax=Aneurinibacillus sp. Ricciae_BoGa-3 TaxID=3022697 RepID=UPI0023415099|nr:DNA-3-methyladenine glycosylase I [Aneurinibacillus sp. Ricciae_BoGa-3]WCK52824.1 DNA-3-methyladenine glycosylase I [Aneurinibacillus sp. Ricciae_BoGa-3]